jgi:hypothetical protein
VAERRQLGQVSLVAAGRGKVSSGASNVERTLGGGQGACLQGVVHLGEGLLGLLEEAKDDGPAELALVLVVVHLQDLLEGHGVDAVAQVGQADGALLALSPCGQSSTSLRYVHLLAGGRGGGERKGPGSPCPQLRVE